MTVPAITYRIFPLGDTALTIDYGEELSETVHMEVMARFKQLSQQPFPGMIEVFPAYSSLTIYYDAIAMLKNTPASKLVYEYAEDLLRAILDQPLNSTESAERMVEIPVCYDADFGPDLEFVSQLNKISKEEIIKIHAGRDYRVYMLGFLPGFAYMGETDQRIHVPRKQQPSPVVSGSIAIAGRQTGIYPLVSPGGWQVIGRTPLKLFDVSKEEPTLLRAGDMVRFVPINKNEFTNY